MRVSAPPSERGGAEGGARNRAGSATNRSRQPGLQNQYVVPACSALPPSASPGVTFMPHTGSITVAATVGAPGAWTCSPAACLSSLIDDASALVMIAAGIWLPRAPAAEAHGAVARAPRDDYVER